MAVANAQAFYYTTTVATVKSFIALAPGAHHNKTFLS
jgi:hypothetical protein